MVTNTPPTTTTIRRKPKSAKDSSSWYTSTYKTPTLRQLSYRVSPFVLGPIVPFKNIRPLALALCSPKLIAKRNGNCYEALVVHMFTTGRRETFLRILDPDSNEPAYLWVRAVLPGYNGKQADPGPLHPYPEGELAFFQWLKSRGLDEDFVKSLKYFCMAWPIHNRCKT